MKKAMVRKVRTPSQVNEADGSEAITPFLKWPGGKQWFTANHSNLFPKTFKRYIEPFLGGASVFFFLRPKKALIGDTNRDLIRAYQTMKVNWVALEDRLRLRWDVSEIQVELGNKEGRSAFATTAAPQVS